MPFVPRKGDIVKISGKIFYVVGSPWWVHDEGVVENSVSLTHHSLNDAHIENQEREHTDLEGYGFSLRPK